MIRSQILRNSRILLIALLSLLGMFQSTKARGRKSIKQMETHTIIWELDKMLTDEDRRLDSTSSQPELIDYDLPKYPKKAKAEGISGKVWLAVSISKSGKVSEIMVCESSGYEKLDEAAKKVASSLRFTPEQINDEPVSSGSSYIVEFIDNEAIESGSTKSDSKSDKRFEVKLYQDNKAEFTTIPKRVSSSVPEESADCASCASVKIIMVVSKEGFVTDARPVQPSGSILLDRAASELAFGFIFEPSQLCGRPVVSGVIYTIGVDTTGFEALPAEDSTIPGPTDFVAVDVPAEMISHSIPIYPQAQRNAGIEGVVWVQALVLKDGSVGDAQVVKTSGTNKLDRSAIDAALKNKFRPGRSNGKPVAMWVTYKVAFKLSL